MNILEFICWVHHRAPLAEPVLTQGEYRLVVSLRCLVPLYHQIKAFACEPESRLEGQGRRKTSVCSQSWLCEAPITCMSIEGRLLQARRIAQTLSSIVSPELTTLYIQYWIQLRDNLSLVRHRADWKDREETNIGDLIHKQGSLQVPSTEHFQKPSEYRLVVALRLLVPLYHQIYQHYISSTGYSQRTVLYLKAMYSDR